MSAPVDPAADPGALAGCPMPPDYQRGVEALDGFPIGHLFAVLNTINNGREPPRESVDAIETWRASKQTPAPAPAARKCPECNGYGDDGDAPCQACGGTRSAPAPAAVADPGAVSEGGVERLVDNLVRAVCEDTYDGILSRGGRGKHEAAWETARRRLLAAIRAEATPPVGQAPVKRSGHHGDFANCANCGGEPHTWEACARGLRGERDRLVDTPPVDLAALREAVERVDNEEQRRRTWPALWHLHKVAHAIVEAARALDTVAATTSALMTPAPAPAAVADPGAVSEGGVATARAFVSRMQAAHGAIRTEFGSTGAADCEAHQPTHVRAEAAPPVDLSALREAVRAWRPAYARALRELPEKERAVIEAAVAIVDAPPPAAAGSVPACAHCRDTRRVLGGAVCGMCAPQEPAEPVRAFTDADADAARIPRHSVCRPDSDEGGR